MSLTLKLTSLGIRTVAKPIGNLIKRQARESESFKKICVRFAQGLHRVDARMRLGLLEDSEAITREIDRRTASAEAKRLRNQHRPGLGIPTVKTKEQTQADEEARQKERKFIEEKVKNDGKKKEARLFKPLSESQAIETGANFASEAFVFMIGVALLLFENYRSRKKASNRKDDVDDKLEWLEEQVNASREEKSALEHHVELLEEELSQFRRAGGHVNQGTGMSNIKDTQESSGKKPETEGGTKAGITAEKEEKKKES